MADLRAYLDKAERGTAARIARALKVHPVMLSQWASGEKAISEDQAPSLELETGFEVPCETSCPKPKNGRWVRVPDADWPNGKPLLDKTPACAMEGAAATPAPVTRQVGEPCTAIETEAAGHPSACDDPAVVDAACRLGGDPRNEYEQYIGHKKQRAEDKPSSGDRERGH